MKKILFLTSTVPNKQNKGGPSGLIWECIQVIKEQNISFDIEVIQNKTFLNKLGIYIKKYSTDINYDLIVIYPFNLFFILNDQIKHKAIVLGPDSPSLLFERFYRNSITMKLKVRNYILKNWFVYKEKILLKKSYKFLVVGRNDSRWLRRLHIFNDNIYYLTHPILQSILEDKKNCSNSKYNVKSLIFAGDMSIKYTNKYIFDFLDILEEINCTILIVGKNNKWIYDLFLSKSNKKDILFVEWVNNYAEICNPSFHIHIIPLLSGAGTKNRTLTACALGVTIVSTSIGLENINYGKPINSIFKFKNIIDTLEYINRLYLVDNNTLDTSNYIKRVNNRFKEELIQYIGIDHDNN